MAHKALPTSHLVKSRLNRSHFIDICSWCKISLDSQVHILWHCEPAKWGWEFIDKWWEIKVDESNLWKSFSYFKSPSVRAAWGIVLASTLWTIWLIRNQYVFEGKKVVKKVLEDLILLRSSSWCESLNIIIPHNQTIWNINPVGLILSSSKLARNLNFNSNEQLYGFVDGARVAV